MKVSEIFYRKLGNPEGPTVIYGHGWARSHRDFIPVAEALDPLYQSILVDLPGFGQTPRPKEGWGTAQYATLMAEFIGQLDVGPVIWVGHSFGGRIGLRLAADYPEILDGLIVVAGAGIPRQRSLAQRLKGSFKSSQFKILKKLAGSDDVRAKLEKQFGSIDYVHSKEIGMRDIFLETVNEDQTDKLSFIKIPSIFIYGEKDQDTPAEMGARMSAAVAGSLFWECPGLDHISILDRGRHQIACAVKQLAHKDVA